MTFNRVKLGPAVTFLKYLASVVALIFLPKTLIWNNCIYELSSDDKILSSLKAHRQIPKKRCFETYFSYDQVCHCSA